MKGQRETGQTEFIKYQDDEESEEKGLENKQNEACLVKKTGKIVTGPRTKKSPIKNSSNSQNALQAVGYLKKSPFTF